MKHLYFCILLSFAIGIHGQECPVRLDSPSQTSWRHNSFRRRRESSTNQASTLWHVDNSQRDTLLCRSRRTLYLYGTDSQNATPWKPNDRVLHPTPRQGLLFNWTRKIIAVNVAVFGLQMWNPSITRWGAKVSQRIWKSHEWHRLATPMFLHGGFSHLLVNSVSLWNVGPQVESLLGPSRFLTTYVAAGVAGNVASALLSPNPSVGASGAILGLIGAYYTCLQTNQKFFGKSGERGRRAMQQTLVWNAIYGLSSPNIDNWGHLGGALGGAATALVLGPRLYLAEGTNRRMLVDKPLLTMPNFRAKVRRLRRKMQTDRYTATLKRR